METSTKESRHSAPWPLISVRRSDVLLSPATDLKCTLPGSSGRRPPPADASSARRARAFPNAKLGGGMFRYFTELNRKRPPVDQLDLVSFTTSALVHAGDDISVIERLESLPAIAASAREIAGGLPWPWGRVRWACG